MKIDYNTVVVLHNYEPIERKVWIDPMCMTSDKMVQKANSVVLISLKETVCCKAPLRARIIGQLAESSFPGVPQLLKLTSSLVGFLI